MSDANQGQRRGAFKRRPGAATPGAPSEAEFIASAGKPVAAYPWIGLDDEKPRALYNLRLTEAMKAQLEYIVENTKYKSMQEYCMATLKPAIAADLEKLTGEGA